jgi:hypothetical protein
VETKTELSSKASVDKYISKILITLEINLERFLIKNAGLLKSRTSSYAFILCNTCKGGHECEPECSVGNMLKLKTLK